MTKAIRIKSIGGPEVLTLSEYDIPEPGEGMVRVRHAAIGVNFIDIYHRTGLYPVPLPSGLGSEASGVVEAFGAGVEGFEVGQRVGYCGGALGAYAQHNNVPAAKLIKLPSTISDEVAAAGLLKGLTAEYLLRRLYRVRASDTVLIHAAAGGVGQIACQWAKSLGATVIGTTSSAEKVEIARMNGCDHVVNTRDDGWQKKVLSITAGAAVPVVYDSIGRDTFLASLDCLSARGLMVSFGNASGPVEPIPPSLLATKGALFLTRPTLAHYTKSAQELQQAADALFSMIESKTVNIAIGQSYRLDQVIEAHIALESRKTTGSTILIP